MMDEQKTITNKGGTMRLGAYKCVLSPDSKTAKAYGNLEISERHRRRFEFNNVYTDDFKNAGMDLVGFNPDTNLVEVIELPTHKYFVGVQYQRVISLCGNWKNSIFFQLRIRFNLYLLERNPLNPRLIISIREPIL